MTRKLNTVGQDEDDVEDPQAVQEIEHGGDQQDRHEERQGDVPKGLSARGSIDGRGLVVLARDGLQPGDQDDHDVPDATPGVHGNHAPESDRDIGQPLLGEGAKPNKPERRVQQPGIRVEHGLEDHTDDKDWDDGRQEDERPV